MTYSQVQPLGWCCPQLSHGGNLSPALTSFSVPGYWVHLTLPVFGTRAPGVYCVAIATSCPSSLTLDAEPGRWPLPSFQSSWTSGCSAPCPQPSRPSCPLAYQILLACRPGYRLGSGAGPR